MHALRKPSAALIAAVTFSLPGALKSGWDFQSPPSNYYLSRACFSRAAL